MVREVIHDSSCLKSNRLFAIYVKVLMFGILGIQNEMQYLKDFKLNTAMKVWWR